MFYYLVHPGTTFVLAAVMYVFCAPNAASRENVFILCCVFLAPANNPDLPTVQRFSTGG